MAGSVNKVIIIGNLGADPEVRTTQAGKPIVNLRIATTEFWRDKNSGERNEKTEWHSVVIFNEQAAKVAQQYLKKGMQVYLEGQIQTRKWQDNSGSDRYTTEVVLQAYSGQLTMLGGSQQNGDARSQADAKPATQQQRKVGPGTNKYPGRQSHSFDLPAEVKPDDDLDDEVPWTTR